MSRSLCSFLLIVVIASNAFAGVHAATHVTTDQSECELCAAYNDPSDAIPADRIEVPPLARQRHDSECRDPIDTQSTRFDFRQRAPPSST